MANTVCLSQHDFNGFQISFDWCNTSGYIVASYHCFYQVNMKFGPAKLDEKAWTKDPTKKDKRAFFHL